MQRRGGLVEAEPAEEAALDDLRLPRVEAFEALERLAQRDQIVERLLGSGRAAVVEREHRGAGAPLCRAAAHGMVDQDVAHRARGDGKKMGAALPVDALDGEQFQVGLVHQVGRGERVGVPFPPQPQTGDAAQFAVHPGKQLIERRRIARRVRVQEGGDLRGRPIRAGRAVVHNASYRHATDG